MSDLKVRSPDNVEKLENNALTFVILRGFRVNDLSAMTLLHCYLELGFDVEILRRQRRGSG
jgi:hypothetical protein